MMAMNDLRLLWSVAKMFMRMMRATGERLDLVARMRFTLGIYQKVVRTNTAIGRSWV